MTRRAREMGRTTETTTRNLRGERTVLNQTRTTIVIVQLQTRRAIQTGKTTTRMTGMTEIDLHLTRRITRKVRTTTTTRDET
jgi:hypothetical protein